MAEPWECQKKWGFKWTSAEDPWHPGSIFVLSEVTGGTRHPLGKLQLSSLDTKRNFAAPMIVLLASACCTICSPSCGVQCEMFLFVVTTSPFSCVSQPNAREHLQEHLPRSYLKHDLASYFVKPSKRTRTPQAIFYYFLIDYQLQKKIWKTNIEHVPETITSL